MNLGHRIQQIPGVQTWGKGLQEGHFEAEGSFVDVNNSKAY